MVIGSLRWQPRKAKPRRYASALKTTGRCSVWLKDLATIVKNTIQPRLKYLPLRSSPARLRQQSRFIVRCAPKGHEN